MKILQRNLISLKKNLSLDDSLLRGSIINQLSGGSKNLFNLATDKSAKDYSLFTKDYYGFGKVPENYKYKYISKFHVYDYFTHSAGGLAKYLEYKLSLLKKSCTTGITEKNLPLWLENPLLFKKIILKQSAKKDIKSFSKLKSEWAHIPRRNEPQITFDLADYSKEKGFLTIYFAEIKSSITTEGVGGREGIWGERKFKLFFKKMIDNRSLYFNKKTKKKYTLLALVLSYKIKKINLYQCIPFNDAGGSASWQIDLSKGFYRTSQKKFNELLSYLKSNQREFKNIEIFNSKLLGLKTKVKNKNLEISTLALYGEDIFNHLLKTKKRITDLRMSNFDDIWLGIYIVINERAELLRYNKNLVITFQNYEKKDKEFRKKIKEVINKEGNVNEIKKTVDYLLNKNKCFKKIDKQYLADAIYFFSACKNK